MKHNPIDRDDIDQMMADDLDEKAEYYYTPVYTQAQMDGVLSALRSFRQWLIMPSADGTEHTAWPERVAQIDAALLSV